MARKIRFGLVAGLCFALIGAVPPPAGTRTDHSSVIAAPEYASLIRAFRAKIPGLMAERKVPGLAVAVITGRRILWQEGFGFTGDDRRIPVTADTAFSVQSMSKTFTAAAVLAAVRDGLVDLDTPITAYLPDFTVNSRFEKHPERRMTLRILLSHRAGFTHEAPDGGNFDPGSGSFENHVRSISETWLRFPVDERYCYSNLGIDLAGYILQVRSGLPFPEYVRRKILEPLGMTNASFDIETIKKDEYRAHGHNPARTPIPVEIPMIPAGGFYASAAELTRFVQFHLNDGRAGGRRILSRKLLAEMEKIPARDPRQTQGYGLGLAVVPYAGTVRLTHSGGGFGFLTHMGWLPDLKLGVVCLTNATGHNLNTAIGEEIMAKFLAAGAGAKPLPPGPKSAAQPPPLEIEMSAADQNRLAGRYLNAFGRGMIIEFREGKAGLTEKGAFNPARFISEDEVILISGGSGIFYRIKRNPDGSPARLIRLDDGESFDFQEGLDDPPGPDDASWDTYIGVYPFKINGLPGGSHRVLKRNGWLYLDHMKLTEHRPGLFFTAPGEALDFTGPVPTWRNIRLEKTGTARSPAKRFP